MRNAWAVCKREVSSFFVTPMGYVVLCTFALISGLGFTASFIFYCTMSESPGMYGFNGVPDFEETFLSPFLVFCGSVIMFIGPLVTMRLFAEERHRGTMELLLTHPLRDREIIAGKYGASLLILGPMLAVVGVYLMLVSYFVDVEPAVLVFGLLAVALMGAAFLSMGLFVSSLCSNQMTAGTITFGLFFVFFILGNFAEDLSTDNPAPGSWPESIRSGVGFLYFVLRSLVQELPLDGHAKDMAQGIAQPYDVAYYVLFAAFFIFLTFRSLESRKWRS